MNSYDQHIERMKKLFSEQIEENNNKIRSQFKNRKNMNTLLNTKIKTFNKENYQVNKFLEVL